MFHLNSFKFKSIITEIANAYMDARLEAMRIAAEEYAKDSYLYGTAKE